MVKVVDRESFQEWLVDRPATMISFLTVRAALRILPTILKRKQRFEPVNTSNFAFIAMRALMTSSVSIVNPTDELRKADIIADDNADANDADYTANLVDVRDSVNTLTDEFFFAISDEESEERAFQHNLKYWTEVGIDAESVDAGYSALKLSQLPLWGNTDHSESDLGYWTEVQKVLENDTTNWSFWIDWYQRILDGRPQNWEMLEKSALIDPEDWDKGAEHVNGLIAETQARYAVKETVEAAQKVLAEYPVASAQMGHNNPPEDIEDDPFTAEDAAFVQKMLDDIGEERESREPDVLRLRAASDGLGKVIRKIGAWLAGKGDVAADAFAKELGKKGATAAFIYALLNALQPVIDAIGTWLPFVGG